MQPNTVAPQELQPFSRVSDLESAAKLHVWSANPQSPLVTRITLPSINTTITSSAPPPDPGLLRTLSDDNYTLTPDSLLSPSLGDQPGYLSSCDCYDLQHILSHTSVHQWGTSSVPITEQQGLQTGDHLPRERAHSPRRTPEEPWDVTSYMSGLTSQFYWCAPSACEEDLEPSRPPVWRIRLPHTHRVG